MVERCIASWACMDGGQIIEAPLAGHAIMLSRGAARQREDFQLFVGGKSSGADRNEEHLAGREAMAQVADSPQRHGGTATSHLVGDLQIGRLLGGGQAQNQPATHHCLGGGMSPRRQTLRFGGIQDNLGSMRVRHLGVLAMAS